jgi:hypothetical protein
VRCFPFDVDRNLVCGFAYYSFVAVSCVLSFVCRQRYAIPQEERKITSVTTSFFQVQNGFQTSILWLLFCLILCFVSLFLFFVLYLWGNPEEIAAIGRSSSSCSSLDMAWQSRSNTAGAFFWSASSVIIASVDLSLAFLVLCSSVITFFTSTFIRLSGLHIPCSCLKYHLEERSIKAEEEEEEVLRKRRRSSSRSSKSFSSSASAREKQSGRNTSSDTDTHFVTREAACVGSDIVCYNSSSSCCARVEEVLPTDLLLQRRESSWKQTGERDARQKPIEELTNATESEEAADEEEQEQEDGDQLHTKQYEELEEPLPQTEREALAAMYLELEKERNASATAANEAMGMIARLQEEKAAVLMEARQFQRVVEQKSMHDQEAIEALREVIARIEEEKRELEEENEFYRSRLLRAQIEESIRARSMPLLTAPSSSAEERTRRSRSLLLQKSPSSTSMGKQKIPAAADVQEEEQSRFTGRTIKSKKHLLRGPIVREEASPEPGLPQLEDSSIIPAKASDVNATSAAVSQVVQARTDAVIGGEGSKALGLGFSSRIDTETTSSPRAMGGNNKKKQIGRAPAVVEKPEEKSSEEAENNVSLSRRLSSQHHRPAPPSDTAEEAAESLEKGQEATASEMSERALEEERRLSVLEYVWKLEEELHQQAGRRAAATSAPTTRGRSKSVGVSRSKTQSPVKRTTSSEETATKAAATMMCAMTDNDPFWQRLYEDGTAPNERHLDAFSSQEQDGNVTTHIQHTLRVDEGRNKERQREAGTSMHSGEETLGQCSDEVLFEHDIYEVQEPAFEPQGVAGDLSRQRHVNLDRLGKPNLLFSLDEDIRDRNEIEYMSDDFTVPLYEAGSSGTDMQCEELQWRAWKGDPCTHSEISRHQAWMSVEDEVQQLTLRLKALEADRHLMKQTINSLTQEYGGMKLLQEIAQQLQELRGMELEGLQQQNSLSDASSFQVCHIMVSFVPENAMLLFRHVYPGMLA